MSDYDTIFHLANSDFRCDVISWCFERTKQLHSSWPETPAHLIMSRFILVPVLIPAAPHFLPYIHFISALEIAFTIIYFCLFHCTSA